MKIAIVANGTIKDLEFHKYIIKKCDYIICADGASNYIYDMNINPDIIIGDLDSIDEKVKKYYEKENVRFETFPSKKDKTDTEISVDYALDIGATEIILLGVIGSRIDHSLGNINLLYYLLKKGIKASVINENNEIYIINDEIELEGKKGDIISVIPCFGHVKGVTLKGLEYPLNDFYLEFGSSRGISNIMSSSKCKITLREGFLLVIKSRD